MNKQNVEVVTPLFDDLSHSTRSTCSDHSCEHAWAIEKALCHLNNTERHYLTT